MNEDILELLKEEHVDLMIRLAFELEAARIVERLDSPDSMLTDAEEKCAEQALISAFDKLHQQELSDRRSRRAHRHRRRMMRIVEILACAVLVIGLSAPMAVANFETLRQRLVEFLVSFDSVNETSDFDRIDVPDGWKGEYFPTDLPKGTQVTELSPTGRALIRFATEDGGSIVFSENDDDCSVIAGAEDEAVTVTDVNGYEARVSEFFEDEYYVRIVWDNGERWFMLETCGLDLRKAHIIAESIKRIAN